VKHSLIAGRIKLKDCSAAQYLRTPLATPDGGAKEVARAVASHTLRSRAVRIVEERVQDFVLAGRSQLKNRPATRVVRARRIIAATSKKGRAV
jgi:hypothetical protein